MGDNGSQTGIFDWVSRSLSSLSYKRKPPFICIANFCHSYFILFSFLVSRRTFSALCIVPILSINDQSSTMTLKDQDPYKKEEEIVVDASAVSGGGGRPNEPPIPAGHSRFYCEKCHTVSNLLSYLPGTVLPVVRITCMSCTGVRSTSTPSVLNFKFMALVRYCHSSFLHSAT